MRAVVQRVTSASVTVENETVGAIDAGMMVLIGVSIRAASIQSDDKTRISTLRLTLDVHSREEMNKVIQALRNKSDILDVYRATK